MAECIKRDVVMKEIMAAKWMDGYDGAMAMAIAASAPAADVAPVVHGRIVGSLEDGRYRRRFSCCGEDATMITQWAWPNYCPNCGAKMDGGTDNGA